MSDKNDPVKIRLYLNGLEMIYMPYGIEMPWMITPSGERPYDNEDINPRRCLERFEANMMRDIAELKRWVSLINLAWDLFDTHGDIVIYCRHRGYFRGWRTRKDRPKSPIFNKEADESMERPYVYIKYNSCTSDEAQSDVWMNKQRKIDIANDLSWFLARPDFEVRVDRWPKR